MFGINTKTVTVSAKTIAVVTGLHLAAYAYLAAERLILRGVQSARVQIAEAAVPGSSHPPRLEIVELAPLEATPENIEQWVEDSARAHNISAQFLWSIIWSESGKGDKELDPEAVSPKGALGLGQVMPYNAKRCGMKPSDLLDPRNSIECAAIILSEELKVYDGDTIAVTEVYNGGPKCLGGTCKETRAYLKRVLARLAKRLHATQG